MNNERKLRFLNAVQVVTLFGLMVDLASRVAQGSLKKELSVYIIIYILSVWANNAKVRRMTMTTQIVGLWGIVNVGWSIFVNSGVVSGGASQLLFIFTVVTLVTEVVLQKNDKKELENK